MNTVTRQEIFTKAYNGLKSQGFKKSLRKDDSSDLSESWSCAYRGDRGRRCAIGWLIPDELYTSEIEGVGIGAPKVDNYKLREVLAKVFGRDFDDSDFLEYLQKCHDESSEDREESMKERLEEFAHIWGVKIPQEE